MFKTFYSEFEKLELAYSEGGTVNDYINIIRNCGNYIESCMNYFIVNFHVSLNSDKDRLKYLSIEKQLIKPAITYNTLGVFIGLIKKLETEFSSHEWIHPSIPVYLNKANILRNMYLNVKVENGINEKKMTIELDADEMLYFTQKILYLFKFQDKYINSFGFDLSNFLIYSSIKERFESASKEEHYNQTVYDAHKIMPSLLQNFLDKIYINSELAEKEQIIKITQQNNKLFNSDLEVKSILAEFLKINWSDSNNEVINKLVSNVEILQSTSLSKKKSFAQQYLNVIDSLIVFLKNKDLNNILEFANIVKKKYLQSGSIIKHEDDVYFKKAAKELGIRKMTGESLEKSIIKTIENKITVFQTFYEEKNHAQKVNNEKHVANLFKYACLKFNDNNFEEAISDLSEIIEAKFNVAFYYIYRGIAYQKTGQDRKAEKDFKKALSINHKLEFYFYNMGVARYEANDFLSAIVEFDKALTYKNNDPDIYFYKGIVLKQLNMINEAQTAFKKAIAIAPKHSGAIHEFDKILNDKVFVEKNRMKKRNISVLFKYACSKLNDKDYSKALIDLNSIIEIEHDIAFYYVYRGITNSLLNNNIEAENDFQYSLKINPRRDFYYYNRGLAYFEAQAFMQAIKEFDNAITLKQDQADYYYFRGLSYDKLKDTKKAEKEYLKALNINPSHTEAPRSIEKLKLKEIKIVNDENLSLILSNLFKYACLKLNENDFEDAIVDFNEIINLKADVAFYYIYRGITYEILNKPRATIADYKKALNINPSKDLFHFNKGMAYYEAGKYERAIRELNIAININKDVPDFYFYTALIYESAGKIGKAISAYNLALEVFPGHVEAKRKKVKLIEKQTNIEKQIQKKYSDFSNAHEFFENARYFLNEKEYENAIFELNKAINILPNAAFYYVYRGMANEKTSNYIGADKNYSTAKRLNPDSAMFYFNKAKAEFDSGFFEKALTEINKAVEINEKFAFVNYRMRIYKKLHKKKEFDNDMRKCQILQKKENLN